MRVALALFAVAVVGCKSASKQSAEPAVTGAANSQAETGTPPPAEAPAPTVTAPPPSPGSAVEEARNAGMLGPADQRAFQTDGKVTIKKFSSKDLDAVVTTKLEALQECYVKALEFHETLAGEITITVKDGTPKITGATLKNADLEKCVVDTLASVALPKPKATLVLAFKRS